MEKICLINPPLTLRDLYKNLAEGGSELPPLGLAGLAAVLRSKGYIVKIIDAMAMRWDTARVVEAIKNFGADITGITSTTVSIYNASELARAIKKEKNMPVLIGGPHVSAVAEETLKCFPWFDVGVIGEGETTLFELLEFYNGAKRLEDIRGLAIRKNGNIIFTGKREFIRDLDTLPLPAWDLLPPLAEFYQPAADSLNRFPSSSLVTSRGCPGKCIFCDRNVFGNHCRAFSAEYVVGMIKELSDRFGIRDIFIHDDNFLVFTKRTGAICELILKEDIHMSWSCMGRSDTVDTALFPLMKRAGCWQINYGLESGSHRVLDILDKSITLERMRKVVGATKKAGIRVKGLFMIGCFGETTETIKQTLKFILSLPLDDFHMTCFTPFPGTEAAQRAKEFGTYDPDWRKANLFTSVNFIPHGLSSNILEKNLKKAYLRFYLRPRIIFYYFTKFKDIRLGMKILRAVKSIFKMAWARQR